MYKYSILTCNGYITEVCCKTIEDAIDLCNKIETVSNDGYSRVVSHNGQLVADCDGILPVYGMSAYERAERSFDAY